MLLSFFAVVSSTAYAANPTAINFQGKVVNANGTNVADGTYSFVFRLYNSGATDPNATTCSSEGTCLWEETQASVSVTSGIFQVELGSSCPFFTSNSCNKSTPIDFSSSNSLYLTMKFNGDSQGFMTPMMHFTSVPYAFQADNANKLGGVAAGSYARNDATNTFAAAQTIQQSSTTALVVQGVASSPVLSVDTSGNHLVLGKPGSSGINVNLVFNNATNSNQVSLGVADGTAGYSLTLPSIAPSLSECLKSGASTAGLMEWGSCGSGGGSSSLQGAYTTSAGASPGITVDSTNLGFTIQNSNTSPITGELFGVHDKTASGLGATLFSIADTGAAQVNGDLTAGSGKFIRIVGSGTRPSSPTAGTLYYDTSSNQFLVYDGTAWRGDKKTATKIVAASNSANVDAADYQANGDTAAAGDGDQVEINSAINAVSTAGGGSVYLMEGTYTIDGSISVKNNVSLIGAGSATIITIANGFNTAINMITNNDTSTGTHVTIKNLLIDGNKSNQTSGTMYGIYFDHMGGGAGSSARDGGKIIDVIAVNIRGYGLNLNTSSNNVVNANTAQGNAFDGLVVNGGSYNTVTANILQNNGTSSGSGIGLYNTSKNTVTANIVQGNDASASGAGIYISSANDNVIVGNNVDDNGSNTTNNGIYLISSDNNSITNNNITDSSCTTNCFAINISNSASDNNYVADNRFSDTDATIVSSINDSGTGTVYANQSTTVDGGKLMTRTANDVAAWTIKNTNLKTVGTFDTSNGKFVLGDQSSGGVTGQLVFNTSSNVKAVSILAGATSTAYSLTLATNGATGSQCLQSTPGSTSSATALQWGSCDTLTQTAQTDGFTIAGGTTSRTLTVTGGDITIGSTIKPTSSGALTVQSNGANNLTLDTGGATVNIATNTSSGSTAVTIGNTTSNPNISFNGSGTFGTTTGANTLNGDTSVAGSHTFATGTGTVSLNGDTTVNSSHTLAIPKANGLTLGSTTAAGGIVFNDGTANSRSVTVFAAAIGATGSYTLSLPTAGSGTVGECLKSGTGTTVTATPLAWGSCGGSSGGVSLQASTPGTPDTGNINVSGRIIASSLLLQNASNQAGLLFDTSDNILKVYGSGGSSSYVSLYYDTTNNVGVIGSSSGVVQVGSGSGNVTVPLTGQNDKFLFTKTYTTAATYGNTDFDVQRVLTGGANLANGNVVSVQDVSTGTNGSSAPNVLYVNQNNTTFGGNLILAQTGGTNTKFKVDTNGNLTVSGSAILQEGVAPSGTTGFGKVYVNSSDHYLHFVNNGGTDSVLATDFNSVYAASSSPATLLLSTSAKNFVITASDQATDPNVLINLQCVTSCSTNGRFAVQNAGSDVLAVSPNGGGITLSGVTTVASGFTLTVGNTTNGVVFSDTAAPHYYGSSRPTKRITLTPEYAGATMTADGSSNNGTMTSDFCSGSSHLNIPTSSNPCAATEEHNYYSWTTTQASAQDYDVYVRYQLPSDFDGMASNTTLNLYGWRTGASDSVTLSLYQANGTQCGTSTNVATGTAAWTETAMTATFSSCSLSPNDVLTFKIHLVAGAASDFARSGEMRFDYFAKF